MADTQSTAETVEELRETLADKKQELLDLRQQRQQAAQDAQNELLAAQLKAEIERVDQDIAAEKLAVENQQNIDIEQVATGVVAGESNVPLSAGEVQTGEADVSVPPPPTPVTSTASTSNGEGE